MIIEEKINRIIIADTSGKYKAFGNVKICEMRIKKEKELKRKLTNKEYAKLIGWLE